MTILYDGAGLTCLHTMVVLQNRISASVFPFRKAQRTYRATKILLERIDKHTNIKSLMHTPQDSVFLSHKAKSNRTYNGDYVIKRAATIVTELLNHF